MLSYRTWCLVLLCFMLWLPADLWAGSKCRFGIFCPQGGEALPRWKMKTVQGELARTIGDRIATGLDEFQNVYQKQVWDELVERSDRGLISDQELINTEKFLNAITEDYGKMVDTLNRLASGINAGVTMKVYDEPGYIALTEIGSSYAAYFTRSKHIALRSRGEKEGVSIGSVVHELAHHFFDERREALYPKGFPDKMERVSENLDETYAFLTQRIFLAQFGLDRSKATFKNEIFYSAPYDIMEYGITPVAEAFGAYVGQVYFHYHGYPPPHRIAAQGYQHPFTQRYTLPAQIWGQHAREQFLNLFESPIGGSGFILIPGSLDIGYAE